MPRLETSGLDEIIADIKRLGVEAEQIADVILMVAAAEVSGAWERATKEAGHVDTGDMLKSIRCDKKPKTINGIKAIEVYPRGKDSKGVRNAEKAFLLHYGTSSIKGSRFVDRAEQLAEPAVQQAAERLWNKYLEGKDV